jgi:hypothetical protein
MWSLMQLPISVTRGAHVTAPRAAICGRNTCAYLHQVEIDKRHVGGVGVDINNICKPQFGQWA